MFNFDIIVNLDPIVFKLLMFFMVLDLDIFHTNLPMFKSCQTLIRWQT